jgi:hypothetical protein
MRKILSFALVLAGAFLFALLLPESARAQFTTVTATVTDPNGIPYAGATMTALLVPASSGGYTLNNKPYSGQIGPVTLDSTGKFSQNFGDVTLITPASAQWQITIDSGLATIQPPLGTGPQSFTFTSTGTTISGSSVVNISASLNALAPKLTNFITPNGGIVPNTPGIPIGNGSVFYATNYGVNPNALAVTGCSGTSGLSSLTCTNGNFIVTDVGKLVEETAIIANPLDLPSTTISTVNSTTNVTVAGTFSRNSSAGEAAYGTDQTTNINTFWNAIVASPTTALNCGAAVFPSGGMIFTSAIMVTTVPVTTRCGEDQGAVGIPWLQGQGTFNTVFIPWSTFAYQTTSRCGPVGTTGCFGPGPSVIANLELYGGMFDAIGANTYNGPWLNITTPGALLNVNLQNFLVPGAPQAVQFTNGAAWSYNSEVVSFGGNSATAGCTAINVTSGAQDITLWNTFIASSCSADGAVLTSTGVNTNVYSIQGGGGALNNILVNGGQTTLTGWFNNLGLKATGASTKVLVTNSFNNQGAAGLSAQISVASGAIVQVSNSTLTNTGANNVNVDATSEFIDGCGNVMTAATATASVTAGGKFIPCPSSTYNGNSLNGTFSLTGTGACATITTLVGNIFAGTFKCTGTTGASTYTLTLITSPMGNGWKCDFKDTTTTANTQAVTSAGASSCGGSGTVNANDVITFGTQDF